MVSEDFLKSFFGCPEPVKVKPKTTDKPNFMLFIFQMLHAYADISTIEPLTWDKTVKDKSTGKKFRITMTMEHLHD